MTKRNLLIVDDHRKNPPALEAILESAGRNRSTTSSRNEALAIALDKDLALIRLDLQIPEMDGFELAGLRCWNRRSRAIPVIS